jgi:hypothetical protein
MAASTAAILGSQLGVAGTVMGAAVGSLASAVAGTLYEAGIERGTRQVKRLTTIARPQRDGTETRIEQAATESTALTVVQAPATDGAATGVAVDMAAISHDETTPDLPPVFRSDPVVDLPSVRDRAKSESHRPWIGRLGVAVASAAAVFAISIGGITAWEALTGRPVSGGQGTSIGQLTKPDKPVAPAPSSGPSSPGAVPSETPTAEESGEPSQEPTPAPTTSTTQPVSPEPSRTTETTETTEPSQAPQQVEPTGAATP